MWAVSDESLLAGLASGDPESATTFVRRFQGRVFGLAMALLRDRQAAEEIAQETFVRAWRYAAAYDPRRGAVSTWLLTICRNLAVDAMRVRRLQPTDPHALSELGIAGGPEPEQETLRGAEAARLRAAIARLPEEQRRALILAAFGGRTAREIADAEDIPLGTAKTRIRAAMLKLRDALEVQGE